MSPNIVAPNPKARRASKDLWPEERQGYSDVRTVAYAASPAMPSPRRKLLVQTEERVATLIATAGLIWTLLAGSGSLARFGSVAAFPPGPLELCAIGILIWLHAKWRGSVKLH